MAARRGSLDPAQASLRLAAESGPAFRTPEETRKHPLRIRHAEYQRGAIVPAFCSADGRHLLAGFLPRAKSLVIQRANATAKIIANTRPVIISGVNIVLSARNCASRWVN